MMNGTLGPLDEDVRLRRLAPAISAIIPVEELGRLQLLRIAASLAQGLPDGYAREILRAAAALVVHPEPITKRVFYSANAGTVAHIGDRVFAMGRLEYLCRLHLEPHKAEWDAAATLERQGSTAYAVVAWPGTHYLGLIGFNPAGVVATAVSRLAPTGGN